jgi:hypothetical protein
MAARSGRGPPLKRRSPAVRGSTNQADRKVHGVDDGSLKLQPNLVNPTPSAIYSPPPFSTTGVSFAVAPSSPTTRPRSWLV